MPRSFDMPPLDRWAREEADREVARVLAEVPDIDFRAACRRLQRLTLAQRAAVADALLHAGLHQDKPEP